MIPDEPTLPDTGLTRSEASTTCDVPEPGRSEGSISSRPRSPARMSAPPARDLAWLVLAAASGSTASDALPSLFPRGWSWKTWPVVRATGCPTSGKGWNDSVTRAFRSRLRRAIAERSTTGAACSSWPTRTTASNRPSPSMQHWPAHRRMMATLVASRYDGNQLTRNTKNRKLDPPVQLARMQGGRLSSKWCHRYMGFPDGWCQS